MPISDLLKAAWQGRAYIFALRHTSYTNIKLKHVHVWYAIAALYLLLSSRDVNWTNDDVVFIDGAMVLIDGDVIFIYSDVVQIDGDVI
jgi:hypothetical protein